MTRKRLRTILALALPIVGGMVSPSDAATVVAGRLPLQIVGVSTILDAIGMVLLQSLLGAGAARTVMVVSIVLQWLLFLPTAYLVGPPLGGGLVAIWLAQGAHRAIQALVLGRLWSGGRWAVVRV